MKWSIKLGRVFGIDVYVHFTFFLLLLFLGYASWKATGDAGAALGGVVFLLCLFGCVLLHEFGHALMARRYGIGTHDITLLPIGGVARLERMPEKPAQELWVALAGPAVNVVIAALLYGWLALSAGGIRLPWVELSQPAGGLVARLAAVNLLLVVFNMLPAFPMDGGRVLRAVLAAGMGRRRATAIAANVGQVMAILFGILGFMANPFLVFIAIFVYLGAQAEAEMVEMQSALGGLTAGDAMMTRFGTLEAGDPLSRAVDELLAGSQQDFPVLEGGVPTAVLRRKDLVKALSEGRGAGRVADAMCQGCTAVDASAPLERAVESMRENGCDSVAVTDGGRLVGLLTLENIGELVMVNRAAEKAGVPAGARWANAGGTT
jgi:Zn-dependent protease/CBS domain-containing protein